MVIGKKTIKLYYHTKKEKLFPRLNDSSNLVVKFMGRASVHSELFYQLLLSDSLFLGSLPL